MKLRFEKEESDMQTIDSLVTPLVALCVGTLMVHVGVATIQLTWRRWPNREKSSDPRARRLPCRLHS